MKHNDMKRISNMLYPLFIYQVVHVSPLVYLSRTRRTPKPRDITNLTGKEGQTWPADSKTKKRRKNKSSSSTSTKKSKSHKNNTENTSSGDGDGDDDDDGDETVIYPELDSWEPVKSKSAHIITPMKSPTMNKHERMPVRRPVASSIPHIDSFMNTVSCCNLFFYAHVLN